MRGASAGVNPAFEISTMKRKPPRMHPEKKTPAPHGADRRSNDERHSDDRRAHARFEPRGPRNDRRQGDRRGTRG
jgi:hypothetical protein